MVVSASPKVRDLRSAIEAVDELGLLARVRREVDPGYEIPNVLRSAAYQPQSPALLFENVRGFPGAKVAAALLAHPKSAEVLLNLPADPRLAKRQVMDLMERPIPPRIVSSAPCKANIVTKNVDVSKIIPWTYGARQSTHRYFQGPIVSKDLETGKQNLAMYRTCIQGPDTVTVNGRWDRHFGFQLSDYKRAGATMPVAIVLGPDPLLVPVAGTRLPYGADDYGFIGAIRGEPIELVRCETQDLLVPANAECVIEGEIRPPYELGDDGPWPEYLRYLGMNINPPLVHVTAVTYRDNPINLISIPGGDVGAYGLGAFYGATFLQYLRTFASTFVVDCTIVPAGVVHHAIIKVRKSEPHHEGLQLNVALAAFGFLVEIDRVTLVDEDIDIYDLGQIEWAISTRCNAANQVHLLCDARTHQNNPIGGVHEMYGDPIVMRKWIVDATIPWKFRVAEKAPGITFFTRSEWDAVDLRDYLEPQDADRWVKRQPHGVLHATAFDHKPGQQAEPMSM